MHPLQLFDQWRRRLVGWLPIKQRWERTAKEVAPKAWEDWLLEPLNEYEATELLLNA